MIKSLLFLLLPTSLNLNLLLLIFFPLHPRRIITPALLALAPHNMELNFALKKTVITSHDHGRVLVVIRHWHTGDLHVVVGFVEFWVDEGFFAEGASYLSLLIFIKAAGVHPMPAPQKSWRRGRRLQITHTHGAVLLEPSCHALVTGFHCDGQAALTCIAVEKVLATTNTTNPTPLTMVNSLLFSLIII